MLLHIKSILDAIGPILETQSPVQLPKPHLHSLPHPTWYLTCLSLKGRQDHKGLQPNIEAPCKCPEHILTLRRFYQATDDCMSHLLQTC